MLESYSELEDLNNLLSEQSYVIGHVPTQMDVCIFEVLYDRQPPSNFAHALRWYKHMASYSGEEIKKFPGSKQTWKEIIANKSKV